MNIKGDKHLFSDTISSWADWGRLYCSIPAFAPLAAEILRREGLPGVPIKNLTPGTNAVFKSGGHVLKIYAPKETGIDQTQDMQTELFAARRASKLGIAAPEFIAHGFIEDKYRFAYMITRFIEGRDFDSAKTGMSPKQKRAFGQSLRAVTDKMNTVCEKFNGIDPIFGQGRFARWEKYPAAFIKERQSYIESHEYGPGVFVHGDLCADNILITPEGNICLIDFADALTAPVCYEHALIASELFKFDRDFLRGYFGEYNARELAETCASGLLIHDFGGDIINAHIAQREELTGIDALYRAVSSKLII